MPDYGALKILLYRTACNKYHSSVRQVSWRCYTTPGDPFEFFSVFFGSRVSPRKKPFVTRLFHKVRCVSRPFTVASSTEHSHSIVRRGKATEPSPCSPQLKQEGKEKKNSMRATRAGAKTEQLIYEKAWSLIVKHSVIGTFWETKTYDDFWGHIMHQLSVEWKRPCL